MSKVWFSALKPVLTAGASILAAIAAIDVILPLAFGPTAWWAPPPIEYDAVDHLSSRIAAVEKKKSAGDLDDARLVAVLGMSSARDALDSTMLPAHDPWRRDWLILTSEGTTISLYNLYGDSLFESDVRPRQFVIAVNELMLHSFDRAWFDAQQDFSAHLRNRQFAKIPKDCSWLYRNHGRLEDWFMLLMKRANNKIRRALHQPMYDWYAPEGDAFLPTAVARPALTAPADELALQWEAYELLLKPGQFPRDNPQVLELKELVGRARRHGAAVSIVVLPESAALRALYPPIAAQRFQEAVEAAAAGRPLPVIDLRAALPDEMYYDYIHPNAQGRAKISAMLPALLQMPN